MLQVPNWLSPLAHWHIWDHEISTGFENISYLEPTCWKIFHCLFDCHNDLPKLKFDLVTLLPQRNSLPENQVQIPSLAACLYTAPFTQSIRHIEVFGPTKELPTLSPYFLLYLCWEHSIHLGNPLHIFQASVLCHLFCEACHDMLSSHWASLSAKRGS